MALTCTGHVKVDVARDGNPAAAKMNIDRHCVLLRCLLLDSAAGRDFRRVSGPCWGSRLRLLVQDAGPQCNATGAMVPSCTFASWGSVIPALVM